MGFVKLRTGFTLMETIVVIIIISILAAAAMPNYWIVVERMRAKEGEQILLVLLAAQKRYSLDNAGAFAANLSSLDVELRTSQYFGTPSVFNAASPLASITRTGSYTLSISSSGVRTCSGGAAGLCTRIGY